MPARHPSLARHAEAGHTRLVVALGLAGVGVGVWWAQGAGVLIAQGGAGQPAVRVASTTSASSAAVRTALPRAAAMPRSKQAPAAVMEAQVANALLADATVRALAADASVAVDATNVSTPPTPQFALTPAQWAAAAHMAPPRLPTLHVVPVAEPSDVDAGGQSLSAGMPPASLEAVRKVGTQADASSANDDATMQAAATTATSVVYTPAQIRLAYGLGAFPAATTANKGSYQGSGQMIAIINAYHNASAGTNLNAFATKFGLPTCTLLGSAYKAGATLAAMVPAPKAGDSCTFQTVYVNAAGAVVSTAPATNASWATEINLDVQWAHAIAPNAKIVLIEAASATGTAMAAAMQLASKLGASAISMSYGSTEYAQVTTLDPVLTGTATWVAASGDSGVAVEWPAASPAALAVGGTLLSNVSPRAEAAWSGSGGGLSVYEKMPSFQSSVTVPGNPANTTANASKMRRGVPDVAYNASPSSGFYLYQSGSWYSVGGTSAGTPQWAAMVALANAVRSLNGKTAFSGTGFQQAVYGAAAASTYRSNYLDITSGSNGTCTTCKTLTGYDLVTGLGTPNFGALLPALIALK